ncbi:hypothetical protein [Nocardia cyriacigeorgica]|uniref:hypothetical protein n=1 Tax=Nocardia cyriacigeorgica TaxID=135487 RepID=UPI00245378BF|nr:hypothetical protein [Nocardia cyriacigeorgica]
MVGDLWIHDERGWHHAARRLSNGTLSIVLGRFGASMLGWETLAHGEGADKVLPLTRVEVEEIPPELRID